MVGGLIKEQEVGVRGQLASQGDAGLLAAREPGRRAVPSRAWDTEPSQRFLDPLIEVVAVGGFETLPEGRIRSRLHGLGALRLEVGQLALHPLDLGRAAADESAHGGCATELAVKVRLLGQQANARASRHVNAASVGLQPAGDHLEQGRLAGTIGPHEADPLATSQGGAHRMEDDEVTDLPANALQAQDGHG